MSDEITPADLSRDLGVSQRSVRNYLRGKYGKLKAPATRWMLTDAQARDVIEHFRSRR